MRTVWEEDVDSPSLCKFSSDVFSFFSKVRSTSTSSERGYGRTCWGLRTKDTMQETLEVRRVGKVNGLMTGLLRSTGLDLSLMAMSLNYSKQLVPSKQLLLILLHHKLISEVKFLKRI